MSMKILSSDYFDASDQYEGRVFTEDLEFSQEGMGLFLPFFCEAALLLEKDENFEYFLHMRNATYALDRLHVGFGYSNLFQMHHVATRLDICIDQICQSIKMLGLRLDHFEQHLSLPTLCLKSQLVFNMLATCHYDYRKYIEQFSGSFSDATKEVDFYLEEYAQ